jgi:hypothetical protein
MPNRDQAKTDLDSAYSAGRPGADASDLFETPVKQWPQLVKLASRPYRNPDHAPCCDKATRVLCVCAAAWDCAEHGERHVGSHD